MRSLIKQSFRRAGLDVRPASTMHLWEVRLAELLQRRGINWLIDIGANKGNYADAIEQAGYGGRFLLIEPLPDAHTVLSRRAAARKERWVVAQPMAISDYRGEAMFQVAANSESSSLLPMLDTHVSAAPESRVEATIPVHVDRLDAVFEAGKVDAKCFVKIDTQGNEARVLQGAGRYLDTLIDGVQVEMSLDTFYEGQESSLAVHRVLTRRGFECWDLIPGWRDKSSLRLMQFDAIYFRSQ